MKNTTRLLLLAAAVLLAPLLACAPAPELERRIPTADLTALDRYVRASDGAYEFSVANTIEEDGATVYVLDMTSQRWRGASEVDEPEWRHWLSVVVPEDVAHETALLFIGGGSNTGPAPTAAPAELLAIAQASNTVAAELRMVPNQPLTFVADEEEPRWEDALIAYTWDKFLEGGDEEWPARLPMTKAAARAMDAITEFAAGPEAGERTVESYVVTGASKRGWTAWTLAAVDERVKALVPAVIDLLNIEPSFVHHYAAYGFWAPAVGDYEAMDLMRWIGSLEARALWDLVEPYEYRDRLTLPKYIVNSAGDQFFLPDSSQFYYDDLPGEKLLRYIPNTDHGLGDSDAYENLLAYYLAILHDEPRPSYEWTVEEDGTLVVETPDSPEAVKLWQASNPEARDFRLQTIGPAWTSTPLEDEGGGVYRARVEPPSEGWAAYMVELTFSMNGPVPLTVTTEVVVTPDTLPHLDAVPGVLPYVDNVDYPWEGRR